MNTSKQESKSEYLFFTQCAKNWLVNLPKTQRDRMYCLHCAAHYYLLAHLSLLDYLR